MTWENLEFADQLKVIEYLKKQAELADNKKSRETMLAAANELFLWSNSHVCTPEYTCEAYWDE